jgi:oxygen-dependent protoporphyrinogen oxidase
VAVIGGGISGLATAHRLHELAPHLPLTLFEQGSRMGGVLETKRQDGFLLEWGADNFITNVPWAMDLCRRIGFVDQLLETDEEHRGAFVVRKGKLHRIPQGFIIMAPSRIWPVVSTRILSPWGKLRMALEFLVRQRKDDSDESLAGFVIRRFGQETYDRLVQPLIGGIYTGDPQKLSLQATMPRFREMEKGHGSLIRAVMSQAAKQSQAERNSSGGRYSMFVAPREGISSLVQALVDRLPPGTVELNAPVRSISRRSDGTWSVRIGVDDAPGRERVFDAVVVATQAQSAASLLRPIDVTLADDLAAVHHSGCCIVSLAYRRDQIAHRMDGFGFVVPAVEKRQVISGSFSSVKYPGRAPEDHVLVRVFIGGALQEELVHLDDEKLVEIARSELGELLGAKGTPLFHRIARLPASMPQYYVGHRQRVAAIQQRVSNAAGLFVTGNAYHGVGIPFCIYGAEKTAERVQAYCQQADPLERKPAPAN